MKGTQLERRVAAHGRGAHPARLAARALEAAWTDPEPATALLGELARGVGAACAAWRGARAFTWAAGRTCADALPRGVPWQRLAPGRGPALTRLPARELVRWPAAEARGVRAALFARGAGGALLWLESPRPIETDGTELLAWVELLEELERAGARRRDARDGQHLARMGRRAGGVVHDLRNQLALAALELERLSALGGPLVALDAARLGAVLADARETCAGFLGGARPGARRVELSALLAREVGAARRLRGPTATRVHLCASSGLVVRAEPALLRRAVQNLLLNAIEACRAGGAVHVGARAVGEARVELEVRDEGAGLSAADLELLLGAGRSASGGSGYGSLSVLDCVEALGARLAIDSERGLGTSCRVLLDA